MKKHYLISLIFTCLLCMQSVIAQISFNVSPTSGCPGLVVTFTNTSTDTNAYEYYFEFNDGSPSFTDTLTTSVTHVYNNSGNYYPYIEVYDSIGNYLGGDYSSYINVTGSSGFYVPDSVCPGDDVNVCSDCGSISWNWNFGDGYSTSGQCCTNHAYSGNGTFTITLIETSGCGTDTFTRNVIVSNNIIPDAGFGFNPNSAACPGDNITFYTYQNSGTHQWDFGDGQTSAIQGPIHFFTSTDTFTVTHIITNGCSKKDTVTNNVIVDSNNYIPNWVSLYIDPAVACPGDQVFTNTSGGFKNYSWDFGDGTADTNTSYYAQHIYQGLDTFYISVTFMNGCGNDTTLTDSVVISNSIGFPYNPDFKITHDMNPACPGDNINFNIQADYSDITWNFGDGTPPVATTQSYPWTNHSYNTYGTYIVSAYVVNNCGIDTTLYDTISITNNAGFKSGLSMNANPDFACPNQTVGLWVDGYFKKYKWNFGDNSPLISNTNNSMGHQYSDTGTYNVSVTVTNNCSLDTLLTDVVVIGNTIGFPNQPWFILDFESPSCPGTELSFQAPNGYSDYVWDFGDSTPGISGPVQYINHTYIDTGSYLVTVLITNQCGKDTTISGTVSIINNAGFPSYLNMNVNPSTVCPGEEINFSAQWGYKNYRWDFGDGTIDSLKNSSWMSYTYTQAGTYTVAVTMTNYCDIDTQLTVSVKIDSTLRISSNITLQINSPACPGEEIQFSAYGNNYKSYIWSFGDGSPILFQDYSNADNIYYNTGSYPVSVTIANACGFDTTLFDTVTIANNVGFVSQLSINIWPVPVCPGDETSFNTNSGYELYTWDFGDGGTAIGSSWANHYYDSIGVFDVYVTIQNHCGVDTTLWAQAVVDSATAIPYWVSLNASSPGVCPGDNVTFSVNGNNFASYQWDFGDGKTAVTSSDQANHKFDSTGTYNVSVTVVNGCGKSRTLYKTIIVSNNALITNIGLVGIPSTACPGDEIQIIPEQGSSSYIYAWDFGDGNSDTTKGSGVKYAFSDTGSYTVTLTAFNSCGNSATTSAVFNVEDSLVPSLGGEGWGIPGENNVAGCPGDAILFFFWGTGNNLWDFGDGFTDVATELLSVENGFNVTIIKHAYSDTGVYTVKLTRTNGCGISATDSMDIIVGNNLLVNGELLIEEPTDLGGYTTCKPVRFLGIGGETFNWNFGDGSTLSSYNPTVTHVYNQPGDYTVSVDVINGCGNSVLFSQAITVFDVGSAIVNVAMVSDITCLDGNDGSAEATISGGQPPFIYLWNNATAQTSSLATGLSAGNYEVTVTDNLGCEGVGSITVADPSPFSLATLATPAQCASNNGTTTVNVTGGGASPFSYLWSNNSTSQTAGSLASGSYSVTVTDADGCTNAANATVSDSGAASVAITSVTNVSCNGGTNGSINVTPSGGTLPYTYQWSNGSTVEDPSALAATVYSLTLTDATGCQSSSFATVAQPGNLLISFTVVNTACMTSGGSATASPSGGTGAYTYLWDITADNQTTQTATGLPAGNYTVTVTDANGCSTTGTASVSNTNSPSVTSTVTNVTCNGLNNGTIVQSVTGGTSPYTYSWTNGSQTKNVINLSAQQHLCIITDATGCLTIKSYTITQPDVLAATATASSATCNNTDGSVSVTAGGGTPPYFYNWTGGSTSSAPTGLNPGNFTVTVTDSKSCSATSATSVSVAAAVQPICVVTVNDSTKKNLIVWEKTSGLGTKGFIIKKEVLSNVYDSIGYVPFGNESSFTDIASDPKTKSERYKISSVDSCGDTSALSSAHKTMHLAANVGLNKERNLILESYEGFNFGQYRIWRGVASNNIVLIDSIVSTATQYSDWDTLTGIDSLFYLIEVVSPSVCTSTLKLKTYNSSKSNTAAMAAPVITGTPALISGNALEIFPNPYSGSTRISYTLEAEGGVVTIEVYNVLGERISVLVDGENQKGKHEYVFSASESGYQPGIYLVKMRVDGNMAIRRIVELK